MLTETQGRRIEILDSGHIQIRRDTIISRDGVEVTREYHRHVLSPGDDLSAEPSDIQQIAAIIWTPEIVKAYRDSLVPQGGGEEGTSHASPV